MKDTLTKISLKPKIADIVFFLLPLLIAAAFFALLLLGRSSGRIAVIRVNGATVAEVDLNNANAEPPKLELPAHNVIRIQNGAIGVVSADCRDQTCVRGGFISKSGQVIVCVPSGLIIEITGGEDSGFDAVTG